MTALADWRSLYTATSICPADAPEIPNLDQLFADELGMLKQLVERNVLVLAGRDI